jgi:hypothetical protein
LDTQEEAIVLGPVAPPTATPAASQASQAPTASVPLASHNVYTYGTKPRCQAVTNKGEQCTWDQAPHFEPWCKRHYNIETNKLANADKKELRQFNKDVDYKEKAKRKAEEELGKEIAETARLESALAAVNSLRAENRNKVEEAKAKARRLLGN